MATAAAVLGGYWLRPPQALALLASISRAAATMWDEAVGSRRVVAIAALDAHGAMLGPSYEATFRTLSTRIELSSPLTGRAEIDAASVIAALRAGHAYLAVDALAQPPILQFHARQGSTLVTEGDDAGDARTAITFELRAAIPGGGSLMLLRNGEIVASSTTSSLTYMTKDRPGAYRAEVYVPGGRNGVLWLASNAIYVGSRRTLAPPSAAHPGAVLDLLDRETWRAEHDPASRAIAHGPTRSDSGLSLHYELGPGPAHAQFAALVRSVPQPLTEWHGVTVEAFASSQMRMSVALRTGNGDRRWQRSMYLDRLPRTIRLPFDEFTPVEANDRLRAAPLAEIAVLMLVVDCNRTMPGSGGTVTVSRVELDR